MSFFTSGFFWFLEGILACLVIIGFKTWMEDRGTPMPFWKWLLLGFWVLWVGFTIAFITTSIGEKEIDAAVKGGIIFSLLAIILGVGFWRLIVMGTPNVRKVQAKVQAKEPAAHEEV